MLKNKKWRNSGQKCDSKINTVRIDRIEKTTYPDAIDLRVGDPVKSIISRENGTAS